MDTGSGSPSGIEPRGKNVKYAYVATPGVFMMYSFI